METTIKSFFTTPINNDGEPMAIIKAIVADELPFTKTNGEQGTTTTIILGKTGAEELCTVTAFSGPDFNVKALRQAKALKEVFAGQKIEVENLPIAGKEGMYQWSLVKVL